MHIFKSGLQNDFELLRILNYWSLNYRGSTVVKLGFTGVYIIVLISSQKHRLWVLVRTALPRRF